MAREDMISPEIQVAAIRDHCTRMGYTLVDVHSDLDQTGRNFARAEVQRVVERIEAGDAEVVVVWKVSRFGRTRRDWYVHSDRLEVAGGRLESATEGYDSATSVGRFTRGMLVELAAFESDRIGDVWREVHAKRRAEGRPHDGRPRFGYQYVDGAFIVDPTTGPILADLYRRHVEGESLYSLVDRLNTRGIPTTRGGLWTHPQLRRYLRTGFGAGLIYVENRPPSGQPRTRPAEWLPGSHEPVIDHPTWTAFLGVTDARITVAPRSVSSPYLLSGMVRCACGGAMHGGRFSRGRNAMYRCERGRSTSGAACPGAYVSCDLVHEEARRWLAGLAADVEAHAKDAADAAQRQDGAAADMARVGRETARLEAALVRLAQQHAEDPESDPTVFRLARADYQDRITATRRRHAELAARAARADLPPGVAAQPLLDEWDTLGVVARREQLRSLIDHVTVTVTDGTPRVVVTPAWPR